MYTVVCKVNQSLLCLCQSSTSNRLNHVRPHVFKENAVIGPQINMVGFCYEHRSDIAHNSLIWRTTVEEKSAKSILLERFFF